MSVALFAMIGAAIKAGTAYWIIFGLYCVGWLARMISNIKNEINKEV